MSLFPDLVAQRGASVAGIALHCCDVADLLREVRGAKLVIADPPWTYDQAPGVADPSLQYDVLSMAKIVDTVNASASCVDKAGARLALWMTWPQMGAWAAETIGRGKGWKWGPMLTGGSWHKSGPGAIGYHWIGDSEPVMLYKVGAPPCGRWDALSNAHNSAREGHSVKPMEWMRGWLRRWTDPGDLVFDVYAGIGSVAVACALEGRRYVGAEIDAERHRRATLRIADEVERAKNSA